MSADPWAALTEEQRAAILAKIRPHVEDFARCLLTIWPDYDFEKSDLARRSRQAEETEGRS